MSRLSFPAAPHARLRVARRSLVGGSRLVRLGLFALIRPSARPRSCGLGSNGSGRQRRGRGSCACSIALASSSQPGTAASRQRPAPSHGPSVRKAIAHGTPFVSGLLHGSESRAAGRVRHRPPGSCLIAREVSGNRCRGAQVFAQPLQQLVALDKRQRDAEGRQTSSGGGSGSDASARCASSCASAARFDRAAYWANVTHRQIDRWVRHRPRRRPRNSSARRNAPGAVRSFAIPTQPIAASAVNPSPASSQE